MPRDDAPWEAPSSALLRNQPTAPTAARTPKTSADFVLEIKVTIREHRIEIQKLNFLLNEFKKAKFSVPIYTAAELQEMIEVERKTRSESEKG